MKRSCDEMEKKPPLVIRSKKPTDYIPSEKFDEYSDEDLWICSKEKTISFQTFKQNLPEIRAYLRQVRVSEGFDIDIVPKVGMRSGDILPDKCCPERWPERYEAFMNLANLSIGFYNKDNRKLFQRFEVQRVDKVNTRLCDLYDQHYLTFTCVNIGRRGVRGDPVTFQALVLVRGMLMLDDEKIIEFVRLKPQPHVEQQEADATPAVIPHTKKKKKKKRCSSPLVTRTKNPRQYILSEAFDDYNDEFLWSVYKEKGLTFETFKQHLPEFRAYVKQVRVSQGFDIDIVPKICVHAHNVLPDDCCPERWPEKYEAFMNLAKLAIGFYNKDNRKRFEVQKVNKVNTRVGDRYDQHYLTFTAVNVGRGGCRGDPVTFQTLVFVLGMLMFNFKKNGKKIIEFCRLMPDPIVEQEEDDAPSYMCGSPSYLCSTTKKS